MAKLFRCRSSALTLTASLYANQLTANLLLLQSSVKTLSTRVLLQNALQRYDLGNNTDANWVRAAQDLQTSLGRVGSSTTLLQVQVFSKNGSGIGGPYSLLNVTASEVDGSIPLPSSVGSNGAIAYLGDNGTGYPSNLYPNLTFASTPLNATFNESKAFYEGLPLYSNSTLILGPWLLNSSFAMLSVTVPIVNNTSATDTLGWLSSVVNAKDITDIQQSTEGLGTSGQILLFSPSTIDQKLPGNVLEPDSEKVNRTAAEEQKVDFVFPPIEKPTRPLVRPDNDYGISSNLFPMRAYPAVLNAYSTGGASSNGAGSLIDTKNEKGYRVSVGYARCRSSMVDWALLVEQSYSEVTSPIRRLRDILLACVFGTIGVLILFLGPVAHFSVRPIRNLREATRRTVAPDLPPSDDECRYSSSSEVNTPDTSGVEDPAIVEARKEGFMGLVTKWRSGRTDVWPRGPEMARPETFRIPGKVKERKHFIQDELTDLTRTFNEMSEKLTKQYVDLEETVRERTRELENSKKAAEVANETKTLFIANISHELKTPLNGILGMCAVCMQEDDPTKIKRSLGIIYKSGDLLLHLLTDLLTFTKNQIGQQLTLEEKEFRLADVCAQLVSIFDKQAKEGRINLRVSYEGSQDDPVAEVGAPSRDGFGPYGTGRIKDMSLWGDQHRILQVIINLVSNSLKFTPQGGLVEVRIRCLGDAPERIESRTGSFQSRRLTHQTSRRSKTKGIRVNSSSGSMISTAPRGRDPMRYSDTALHINGTEPKSLPSVGVRERSVTPSSPPLPTRKLLFEFEVEDSGPGIPEDQRQRVFEPFMQGDLGLSRKYGGTGLGLSICSQLAALMKGDIQLESHVGKGSKFTMRIPLNFIKELADSTVGSQPNSRRSSIHLANGTDDPESLMGQRRISGVSISSEVGLGPAANVIDAPNKPRLVGFSQPFFATSSPIESPDEQLQVMERVTAEMTAAGGRIRVLVAEDNKVNQEVVLRMLKLEDIYGMIPLQSTEQAADILTRRYSCKGWEGSFRSRKGKHGPKATLQSDLYGCAGRHSPCGLKLALRRRQMPNLDGIQSTRLIRGMGYSAPIVALTAFAEESNKKECKDSGMDDFLAKPIKRPELKKLLKQYCATIPEAPEDPLLAGLPDQDIKITTKGETPVQQANVD